MTIPTYDQLIDPLPHFLVAHPDGVRAAEAHEAVAEVVGLTEEDRAERLPSGIQQVYKNRIGWAHDRLKRAGLSASPRSGFWRLTPEGFVVAKKNKRLSEEQVTRLARVRWSEGPGSSAVAVAAAPLPVDRQSPDDRIDAALREIRDTVARDLLERIALSPPDFFERLVLDLLHAMGYGADRSSLKRVGGSGDGGIDGIISMDKLGLDRVYVQAKRWKNDVGAVEIQGFMGALQLQDATRGVFLSTSSFTKPARDAASKAHGRLVLVDGQMLAELMMDHEVAVTQKALLIPKVDGDYFDE
jgi:restriction system protein